MLIRVRAIAERVRGSLFYIPALFVVAAALATWLVTTADERYGPQLGDVPILLSASVDSARSVLSTIAGATITVAGIVFSVTVVSVQLASSQFSPRVLRGFLRDRFSQVVIGVVVGTFTYALLLLTQTRASGIADGEPAVTRNLGLTVAVVLAATAILAIVAFIDHSARSMQVGEIIARVTQETRDRIESLFPPPGEREDIVLTDMARPHGDAHVVPAPRDGWVQQLDSEGVLRALPPGASARLDVRIGTFVTAGAPLVTVWPPPDDPDGLHDRLPGAFGFGRGRTMQQDVLFGIRQLVDIALRALSPGINDPTTAHDVLVSLGAVVGDVLTRDLPSRVERGPDDRVLYRPHDPTHADFVHRAFDQIRIAAAPQPGVVVAVLHTLERLNGIVERAGVSGRAEPLRRQAELVVATFESAGHLDHDVQRVRRAAIAAGLLEGA